MAKVEKWYKFTFEDGTYSVCRGMSQAERTIAQCEHGKIISKVLFAETPMK